MPNSMKAIESKSFIYLFISFYLPHNNYKKYRKSRKKEVAWRPFKQNL